MTKIALTLCSIGWTVHASAQAVEDTLSRKDLEPVVVTGVSKATRIRDNPLAMKAVSRAQLEQSAAANVIDAIASQAPGLETVKTGPNVSKPFIDGLGYNRVLTLYDGMRVETQQWGDEHGVPMDDYIIGRAEVIKGPASLMYGSDAIAGVLSLFPLLPEKKDKRLHIRYLSEYQGNNGLWGNSLILSRGAQHWSWALRGSGRVARNYTDPVDGRVYNTGFRTVNASGFLGYTNSAGFVHLNATVYDNHQGIPDGSRDSLTRAFTYQVYESPGENTVQPQVDTITNRPVVPKAVLNSYALSPLSQRIQDYRVYADGQWGGIKALVGGEQNIRREYDHPTAPGLPGEYIVLNTLNYSFRYNAPTLWGIEPAVGLGGMVQRNTNRSATDFPIPDYHLFDAGGYAYGKWTHGRWIVAGGFRYDHREERGAEMHIGPDPVTGFFHEVPTGGVQQFPPFHLVFQGVSGSAGAVFRVSPALRLKANIARGYRAPNITEIASNGLDPGAHIVYEGNLDFVPEFSFQEDAGFSGIFSRWSFDLDLFNNNIHHYIYEDQVPVVVVPGNKTFQFQQTNARLYGGDATLNLHPWTHWGWDNTFSCVYGVNRKASYAHAGTQGEYLPFIPPPRWQSRVRYTVARWTFQLESDVNAAQNRYLGLYHTETPTPAYTLFNVHAHFRHGPVQWQLQVNNVLNTAYQNHLSRLQYFEYYTASPTGRLGIFEMGRNICGKVIIDL
jgi:iron complex outermembrane receptor protein